jgi:hypothetical protein
MDAKEFWKSKTFWFNVLALVVIIAQAFGFAEFSPDARLAEYGAVAVTIINLILRFVTAQPVSLSKTIPRDAEPITFSDVKRKADAPKRQR